MAKKKKTFSILNVTLFIILVLYSLILLILLLWGLSTSLKTYDEFGWNSVGLPSHWAWDNYPYVLSKFYVQPTGTQLKVNILGQAVNTILYAVGGSFVTTFCCCIVSYCAAKFNFVFCKILYPLVILVMIIPIVGSTPSMLLLLRNLNIYDTWIGTYFMKFTFLGIYFLVFFGIYEGISSEFSEAATIDGASEFQVFFTIMLPLVKTTFYTVFLVHFIDYWNDYNMALMYMPMHPTLAFGVYKLSISNESGLSNPPARMVACFILALPLTVIFIAFRNKLLGNTTEGGVKE